MRHGRISASLIAVACFVRELPLFFSGTPKTPLRVLCLIAFDALHCFRSSKPLPRHQIKVLANFLDFAACTNAALDHKPFRTDEYQAVRRGLESTDLGSLVDDYVRQLCELENQRPSTRGDRECFNEVRAYRGAVVRLSLETLAAIALGDPSVEDKLGATLWETDLELLFRIVMQCQIIDDVLDYTEDAAVGLPSFLTAPESLSQAFEWTAEAARSYAAYSGEARSASDFPFRVALGAVSAFTQFVIRACSYWRLGDRASAMAAENA